jgi:hypothetical protein
MEQALTNSRPSLSLPVVPFPPPSLCRYTKNLPPGVIEMNKRPQPVPAGLQTVDQIKKIMEEARKAHGQLMGAGVETDQYIDDAIDGADSGDEA